jgi:hypothetical protein
MKLKDILEATTVAGINMGKPGLGGTDWWRFQIEGDSWVGNNGADDFPNE